MAPINICNYCRQHTNYSQMMIIVGGEPELCCGMAGHGMAKQGDLSTPICITRVQVLSVVCMCCA